MIMDATKQAIHQELAFSVGLVETVIEYRLDHPEVPELPEMMAELGQRFQSKNDVFSARRCFETASKGFALSNRDLFAVKMTVAVAQTWVSEAELRGSKLTRLWRKTL
ncbi:hypothetical protein P0D90_14875 [Pseudomonas sp. CBSPCBW29]|nr:hypothetical protein P0D90_14875 [Pseudomonas sp. CBSPCBW29]